MRSWLAGLAPKPACATQSRPPDPLTWVPTRHPGGRPKPRFGPAPTTACCVCRQKRVDRPAAGQPAAAPAARDAADPAARERLQLPRRSRHWYRVTGNSAGFNMSRAAGLFQPFVRLHPVPRSKPPASVWRWCGGSWHRMALKVGYAVHTMRAGGGTHPRRRATLNKQARRCRGSMPHTGA